MPTRFDIHADAGRKAADHPDADGDHHEQVLIATALALAASAPLAFAKTTTPPASILTTEHCASVERSFDNNRSHYKSKSAFLTAEQKATSLCKSERHRDGNVEFGTKAARS
ncbi:MAG TPA: hypothetical protein VJ822_17000 [Dongiaceae bacterium]|nr:hypothetical protein [Dongiaceae bacterium]